MSLTIDASDYHRALQETRDAIDIWLYDTFGADWREQHIYSVTVGEHPQVVAQRYAIVDDRRHEPIETTVQSPRPFPLRAWLAERLGLDRTTTM